MKKVYVASPFFNEEEKNVLNDTINHWKNLFPDYDFYIPMEHEIPDGWSLPNHEWAAAVFEEDVKAIRNCDEVWAVYHGLYSDSGTAWECGFAYGIGKPVKIRPVLNCSFIKGSLMICQGAKNKNTLKNFLYQT